MSRRITPTRAIQRPTSWSVKICKVGRPILLVFPLYCHQRPITERPIEIIIFGRSEQLVWTTKQSSDRPTNNIRHVKYFAQKPRRPIDSSFTLDVRGTYFGRQQQLKDILACGTVISESQRPNFGRQCYFLLNFTSILCVNWSLHCTVLFTKKATSPADKI